jgi:hypothetical protein
VARYFLSPAHSPRQAWILVYCYDPELWFVSTEHDLRKEDNGGGGLYAQCGKPMSIETNGSLLIPEQAQGKAT